MTNMISTATKRNWEKLNTDSTNRLKTRANKLLSTKTIIPIEYFSNKDNYEKICEIIEIISNNKIGIFEAIYSIALNLLDKAKILDKAHVQQVLNNYIATINDKLFNYTYPKDERDLLGIIYQSLLSEGNKNKTGSYYTPINVVKNMTSWVTLNNNKTFLDPCCGSGSFLLSLNANPNQLFGYDNDFIAVFICKINLLLKFKKEIFIPQIYHTDFLNDESINYKRFDYIITNPPWGVYNNYVNIPEITSKESFSYFFVKSFKLLKKDGIIRFLFPASILNVKNHKDMRSFMLNNGDIESITLYDGTFSGVTTHYVDIELVNKIATNTINLYSSQGTSVINKENFYLTKNLSFNFYTKIDIEIINHIRNKGRLTLKDSVWALGIVTGNNKEKLYNVKILNSEPIYTGKEIMPYKLKEPQCFIIYDRSSFQQVAQDNLYRAKEKLVYKFISNRLVFSYDNSGALFLNSANILIPKIYNMSIKSVLAFLNSELYQYLYHVLFSDIKILKGNLMELPFPIISEEEDLKISSYVSKILEDDNSYIDKLQEEIYSIFSINETYQKYIKEKLNGTIN